MTVVCAEIPDKQTFPELYQIVTKLMMHGPCGVANPNSPCMEDDKCTSFLKISQMSQWSLMSILSTGEEMMASM